MKTYVEVHVKILLNQDLKETWRFCFFKIATNDFCDSITTYDFWVYATEKRPFFLCSFQMEEYIAYFLQIFLPGV